MNITTADKDIEKILFTKEEIDKRVKELGKILTAEYKGKRPIVACILKGASFFFIDLCREIKCHIEIDFLSTSSYGISSKSSGVVKMMKDFDEDITGRDVIIVEDIIDSGLTLKYLKKMLATRNPKSVKTVCFLDKQESHDPSLKADYIGYKIADEFVVGYGLDYANYYRNLPYIGVLRPEAYMD